MSAYLLGMAFKCDMETPTRKLVLLKQIDACEEDGTRIFPAMATVARAAQCSKRQVQREIAKFVAVGLLVLVREGGSGPRSTNEYRLDLGVLKRISEVGWKAFVSAHASDAGASPLREGGPDGPAGSSPAGCSPDSSDDAEEASDTKVSRPRSGSEATRVSANKDDTESPLDEGEKGDTGDTPRVTPATDKGDSWSHTTPPYPSPDPSLSGGDAAQSERETISKEAWERRFWKLAKQHPDSAGMPKEGWLTEFMKLDEQGRETAIERHGDWIAELKRQGRNHFPALSTYFRQRLFDEIAPRPETEKPLELGAYGKGWMALRLWLLANLPRQKWQPTAIQQRLIAAGKGAQFETNRQQGEYPRVHALDIDAARGLGARFAPGAMKSGDAVFDPSTAESYVRIRRGSAEWLAWEDWHGERGWPWIDPPGHVEWVYVPSDFPAHASDAEASPLREGGPVGPAGSSPAAVPDETIQQNQYREASGR